VIGVSTKEAGQSKKSIRGCLSFSLNFFAESSEYTEADGIVLGTGDQMDQLLSVFIHCLFEDEKGGAYSKVGIQRHIAAPARLPGLEDHKPCHASDEGGGISVESLGGVDPLHSLVQFSLQRTAEGFPGKADKQAHEPKVMAPDVLGLGVVARFLAQGFDCGHLPRFLGCFDSVSDKEEAAIELDNGKPVYDHGEPLSHEGLQLP
jgi:hypothetical protein